MYLTVSFCVMLLLYWETEKIECLSSPIKTFASYESAIELQSGIIDLHWRVIGEEITFELHMKTLGWIALGISPAGGMRGADIGVGWITNNAVHFQDRFALDFSLPVIDNTTTDWFVLNGKEENGWTALQFKRKLDTCDSMDVAIKFGTSALIYAYGLEDPNPDITYHEIRRGSRILPLLAYGNPPDERKFDGLETYEFKFNNFIVPAIETVYHCKVFKAPPFREKRHAVAQKMLLDEANRDIVHHLLIYECDPSTVFADDNNLPDNACDIDNALNDGSQLCRTNMASIWAVGGDLIEEYPEEAGYPLGGHKAIKYYVLEMHYNNPRSISGRRDSSGIRFYLSPTLRPNDLGYLTFGSTPNALGLAIPPNVERFNVDSYCHANATKNFPATGITVVTVMAHTHLQGRSVWTKLIRNGTAIQYLFNTNGFDFNYQFEHVLQEPIQLYPGDEFATRCVYSTTNKNVITLGGEPTKDEMCSHVFSYYPRMNDIYTCLSAISEESWSTIYNGSMNDTSIHGSTNHKKFVQWLLDIEWSANLAEKWQTFFNTAELKTASGTAANRRFETLFMPKYKDLPSVECKSTGIKNNAASLGSINIVLGYIYVFVYYYFL